MSDLIAERPSTVHPVLEISRKDGFFEFDRESCKALGDKLRDSYVSADPFPHIVIDNLVDADVLRQVIEEFPERQQSRFSDAHSQLKTGYAMEQIRSAYINDLLAAFNSASFVLFLQRLTGIKGLVTDAHFTGGGLHETYRGGHLSVHADFNIHPHTKLQRRLNLILFLNDDWAPEYGGNLELWDKRMTHCVKTVSPIMARAVIFNTDSSSFHGHPEPVECPDGVYRRSIALYYYTLPTSSMVVPHTTLFKPRPGTNDSKASTIESLKTRLRLLLKQRD